MLSNALYENYHKGIKLQKYIVSETDFTYKNILSKISKYVLVGGNALDVGSATGTVSFFLASLGANVDGVELSKTAVKKAKLNKIIFSLKNVNFINSSFEKYEANKKYNLVTCLEVLEHLVNVDACLQKINKFMLKNSILIVSVPSKNAPLYKLGLLNSFDKKVGHLRRYSMREIRKVLNRSEFIILEQYKTEGILRNLLFTNNFLGIFIRSMKFSVLSRFFSFLDDKTIPLFGESQLILICKKR